MYNTGHIDPWWTTEHLSLTYKYRPTVKDHDIKRWIEQGYPSTLNFNGEDYNMEDIRQHKPDIADRFMNIFPWEQVGISFFRMNTCDILPVHQDHYTKYQQVTKINNPQRIRRAIIFLEDWASGHYFEVDGQPILNWHAGDYVIWHYDTPHFAGNFGITPRYTVQITGITKN